MSTLSLGIKEKGALVLVCIWALRAVPASRNFMLLVHKKPWELQDFRVPQIPPSLVLAPGEENSNFIPENRAGNVMYPYPCALSQILPSCAGNVEQSHEASLQSRFPSSPGRGFAFYKNLQQLQKKPLVLWAA